MDIASVFEWCAQESSDIARQVNEPKRRDTLTKLALLRAAAAADLRAERCNRAAPQYATPGTYASAAGRVETREQDNEARIAPP